MSGYLESELVGNHYSLLSYSEQTNELDEERNHNLMAGKAWRGEVQHRAKNGMSLWFDCVVIPVRDSGGVIASFLVLGLPITDRKLREGLQEETISLLETIAFRASHGIRGPLARITGLSNLVQKRIVEPREFELIAEKLIICSEELNAATSELVAYVGNHQEQMMSTRHER
jgi:hypothetical protein